METATTYRGLTLDPFQIEAIRLIEAGESVLVSAPTGTGKTLVADYLIDKTFHAGRRVVYTAPIKALSNQKFKEFKRLLGEEHVGILTGDVVVRPEAPIVIMTTEIFRNLLHMERGRLDDVAYVVFDEIHYIDDPTRGSVWEESLIFMPPHMRFLGLSATIPNLHELAEWVSGVQGRKIHTVQHLERAVPLEHRLYERSLDICTREQLLRRYNRRAARLGVNSTGRIQARVDPTTHMDLLHKIVPAYLPVLFFTFSRRRCEAHAHEAALARDLLTEPERAKVREVIARQVARYQSGGARRLATIEPMLLRGIGYHHAGMLPMTKDIVEELFESRLVKLLYCTETFAVGLNFPCRTVCFDAMTKWDGTTFRSLSNREYFQMAGRAGRRGLDEQGSVFAVVDFNFFSPTEFPSMREEDVEPLQSRFTLTYNTVINLIRNYTPDEIRDVLQKNFAAFQARGQSERLQQRLAVLDQEIERTGDGARKKGRGRGNPLRKLQRQRTEVYKRLRQMTGPESFHAEFQAKRALLEAMNYIEDGKPTARGLFAAHINGRELLITELFFRGVFHDFPEDELNALAASIDYEPRKGEGRPKKHAFDIGPVLRSIDLIRKMEQLYLGYTMLEFNDQLGSVAYKWSRGERFADVLQESQVDEGDLVYTFRRCIDVLRQVRNAASEDAALTAKLSECIQRMDRDEVSILL